jgi:hypothetical protein
LSDWFNAISSILKSPAEGCGGFVVLLDVTDQLSGEVGRGIEDAPRDDTILPNVTWPGYHIVTASRNLEN